MGDFANQVDRFARKVTARTRAIGREAVQETISHAQRVHKEGGRMRVDTGFLRASVQAALGTMPRGPTANPDGVDFKSVNQAAGAPVAVVLLRWDPMKRHQLYVGWTAGYARYREAKDGFLQGAVENWDIAVANATHKAQAIR